MARFRLTTSIVLCFAALCGAADGQQSVGREAVHAALQRFDRWLAGSQHASPWHSYLLTDDLRRELAKSEAPDVGVLLGVLQRLSGEAHGLELPPIAELRRELQGWLVLETLDDGRYLPVVVASILRSPVEIAQPAARLVSVTKPLSPSRRELRARLVALTVMLSAYAERPDDDLAAAIDSQLSWLEASGQAQGFVRAVHQYYGQPNVWIDISEDLLDDTVEGTMDRHEPVKDVILGTPLSGEGRFRATSDLVIEPHPHRAVLKIIVRGELHTETVGRSGPANIHAQAITTFNAQKHLLIDGTGLKVRPTTCRAETRTFASNVSTIKPGLRGRVVRRVGERRWQTLRSAADEEGARHAEQRICAEVDRRSDALIERLDRLAIVPMLALANASGNGARRSQVTFCTEKHVLRIGVFYGSLGAPPGQPDCDSQRPFVVRVHSSLLGQTQRQLSQHSVAAWRTELFALAAPFTAVPSGNKVALAGLAQFLGASPRTDSLVDGFRWQEVAWRWLKYAMAPRLTAEGIALADGRWGTVFPAGFRDNWFSVQWKPPSQPVASARPSTILK